MASAPATTSASPSSRASAGSVGSSAGRTGCRSPAGACTRAGRRSGWPPPPTTASGWIASMRHIAIEAGAFVVSVPQHIPRSAFPADFPLAIPREGGGARPRRGLRRVADRRRDRRAALRRVRASSSPTAISARGAPRQAVLRRGGPLRASRRARPSRGVGPWRTPFQVTIDSAGPRALGRVLVRGARLHRAAAATRLRHLGGRPRRHGRRPLRPRPGLRHRRPGRARARACSSSRSPRARPPRTASTSTSTSARTRCTPRPPSWRSSEPPGSASTTSPAGHWITMLDPEGNEFCIQ